jgi:DHA1 family tetracycline resistance protein-like MFS transporter
LQSIISGFTPANEQGELQGALASLMSATTIFAPPVMTNLFAYFTTPIAPVYFPGAPFLLSSVLILLGIWLAAKSLKAHPITKQKG